jgi:hypothetical protein
MTTAIFVFVIRFTLLYVLHITSFPKWGRTDTASRREKDVIYCLTIQNVMKKFRPLLLLLVTVGVLSSPSVALCQAQCNLLQVNNAATAAHASNMSYWFGVMELPFLFIAVFFAFLTAHALRGGRFGKGMTYMAWGFLVMAVGHLHMQIEHYYLQERAWADQRFYRLVYRPGGHLGFIGSWLLVHLQGQQGSIIPAIDC